MTVFDTKQVSIQTIQFYSEADFTSKSDLFTKSTCCFEHTKTIIRVLNWCAGILFSELTQYLKRMHDVGNPDSSDFVGKQGNSDSPKSSSMRNDLFMYK